MPSPERVYTDGKQAHKKMFNIIREHANQNITRYNFTLMRMAKIKGIGWGGRWQEIQEGGIYVYAMAPHSSTLAWKIPWMEEPGRLQSMGSHRVGHD